MLNHTLPSIEEFAAFLDGNLSQNDMQQISQLATHNGALHQLLDANSLVDETLRGFTDADLQLPSNLVSADFELPTMPPAEEASTLISLSPEPTGDMFVATCEDDDISMSSDINQDDQTTIGEDMHDDSSLTMLDNEGFDNNDDLFGSFSDNIY